MKANRDQLLETLEGAGARFMCAHYTDGQTQIDALKVIGAVCIAWHALTRSEASVVAGEG